MHQLITAVIDKRLHAENLFACFSSPAGRAGAGCACAPASAALCRLVSLSAGAERRNQQRLRGSQRLPSCVLRFARGFFIRGYSDSLRLRKLIPISLFSSGSFSSFQPELEPLSRRAPLGSGVFGLDPGQVGLRGAFLGAFSETVRLWGPDLTASSSSSPAGVWSRLPHSAAGRGASARRSALSLSLWRSWPSRCGTFPSGKPAVQPGFLELLGGGVGAA